MAKPGRRGGAVRRTRGGPLLARPLTRRRWLRLLAWVGGALVLLAHIYTLDTPAAIRNSFAPSLRDVVYHSGMLALFTLAFRASLTDNAPRAGTLLRPADATALWVCCGWGAFCECLQLLIPAREFNPIELTLNTGVPVLVVALYSLAARRAS